MRLLPERRMNLMATEAIIAIITAVGAVIVSIINAVKQRKIDNIIKEIQADTKEYYVICPNCGNKIILKKVEIKDGDSDES